MDKMQMAQDYIIAEVRRVGICSIDQDKIMDAWKVADVMQTEADERNKAEAEQKRKEMREMLNAPNTFVEREGQHFDDVEEWQPDWSQAPKWAKWWAADADGDCYYFEDNPEMKAITWMPFDASNVESAPSFGYTGNWKESLRERPE